MTRSKASVDGDDQRQEFQLLKQDVQENQNEISAIRAEISAVSMKQDQFNTTVDGMQLAVSDLSSQIMSMSATLQSLRLPAGAKQPDPQQPERALDDRTALSPRTSLDQSVLMQKRMEVEALRRQLMVETEISRRYQ
jgi:chromosome segregation ATPase